MENFSQKNLKVRHHIGGSATYGRIILKCILKKQGMKI
jgi:hypothetical protein